MHCVRNSGRSPPALPRPPPKPQPLLCFLVKSACLLEKSKSMSSPSVPLAKGAPTSVPLAKGTPKEAQQQAASTEEDTGVGRIRRTSSAGEEEEKMEDKQNKTKEPTNPGTRRIWTKRLLLPKQNNKQQTAITPYPPANNFPGKKTTK